MELETVCKTCKNSARSKLRSCTLLGHCTGLHLSKQEICEKGTKGISGCVFSNSPRWIGQKFASVSWIFDRCLRADNSHIPVGCAFHLTGKNWTNSPLNYWLFFFLVNKEIFLTYVIKLNADMKKNFIVDYIFILLE